MLYSLLHFCNIVSVTFHWILCLTESILNWKKEKLLVDQKQFLHLNLKFNHFTSPLLSSFICHLALLFIKTTKSITIFSVNSIEKKNIKPQKSPSYFLYLTFQRIKQHLKNHQNTKTHHFISDFISISTKFIPYITSHHTSLWMVFYKFYHTIL